MIVEAAVHELVAALVYFEMGVTVTFKIGTLK